MKSFFLRINVLNVLQINVQRKVQISSFAQVLFALIIWTAYSPFDCAIDFQFKHFMTGTPTLYLSIIHSSTRVSRFGRVKSIFLEISSSSKNLTVNSPFFAWCPERQLSTSSLDSTLGSMFLCSPEIFFWVFKEKKYQNLNDLIFMKSYLLYHRDFSWVSAAANARTTQDNFITAFGSLSLSGEKKAKRRKNEILVKGLVYIHGLENVRFNVVVLCRKYQALESNLLKCQKDLVHLNFVRNVVNEHKKD